MAENHIASDDAFAPEAATDEPASSINNSAADDDAWPQSASEAEEEAYWKGMTQGIRGAGREPAHPHMPADFPLDLKRDGEALPLISAKPLDPAPLDAEIYPVPARTNDARHDGFTPGKRRIFLQTLAACGVVSDACRMARIARPTAYNLRNCAEGRAFALAWDAAILIARGRAVDEVMSRSMCGVIDRVYRNGELVAERHRYDNRLTMAVLTRLDRQAEGLGEGAATARTIAQEWDQFLDIVEDGGERAAAFLTARTDPPRDGEGDHAQHGGGGRPPARRRSPDPLHPAAARRGSDPLLRPREDLAATAATLARLASYRRHGTGLPQEIPTADLDPAAMASWTDEQWARADASGLLDRLAPSQWPDAARSDEAADTDGMCKLRNAYLTRHPPRPEPEDDFQGCTIWETDGGEWHTDFPAPSGFDGWEGGDPANDMYERELSEAELAALAPDLAERAAEHDAELAARHAARDRFFGFAPAPPPDSGRFRTHDG